MNLFVGSVESFRDWFVFQVEYVVIVHVVWLIGSIDANSQGVSNLVGSLINYHDTLGLHLLGRLF